MDEARWNFEFHYHTDKANAAANMATARFRPLTVSSALAYQAAMLSHWTDDKHLIEVLNWNEKYGSVN
jgi:hypothetical protein